MREVNTRMKAVFATALLVAPQLVLAQSDLERYIDKIRKSGMTEDAAGSLESAASILSGATIFAVTPAPDGSLGRSYSSAMCFRPGADGEKVRALREKIEAKEKPWVAFLKKHADTDGSGFVSSEEGSAMRRRVELGLLVGQVPEIKTVDDLVKATRGGRAEVVEDLAVYGKLQVESVKQGMDGMPPLPKYLVQPSSRPGGTGAV